MGSLGLQPCVLAQVGSRSAAPVLWLTTQLQPVVVDVFVVVRWRRRVMLPRPSHWRAYFQIYHQVEAAQQALSYLTYMHCRLVLLSSTEGLHGIYMDCIAYSDYSTRTPAQYDNRAASINTAAVIWCQTLACRLCCNMSTTGIGWALARAVFMCCRHAGALLLRRHCAATV